MRRRRGVDSDRAAPNADIRLVETTRRGGGAAATTTYVVRNCGVAAVDRRAAARRRWWASPARVVRDLFLPEGYPESVAAGYGAYQAWDVAQGLSSYVRANLAYKATLEGLGVGDVEASAMSGALAKIARDASSMAAGLALAYGFGGDFGRRVRQWRLAADVANDVGMALQMAAPLAGKHFVYVACLAACCQCACGVCAGATKASISAHFAAGDNFAELVSKEGSQETLVNIVGLIAGYGTLSLCNRSPTAVWGSFGALTAFHILANVLAIRHVVFDTVNEPRFASLFDRYRRGASLDPRAVAADEPLLPSVFPAAARVSLGASVRSASGTALAAALARSGAGDAVLLVDGAAPGSVLVLLRPCATPADVLDGRFRGERRSRGEPADPADAARFRAALAAAGWDLAAGLLDAGAARVEWAPGLPTS